MPPKNPKELQPWLVQHSLIQSAETKNPNEAKEIKPIISFRPPSENLVRLEEPEAKEVSESHPKGESSDVPANVISSEADTSENGSPSENLEMTPIHPSSLPLEESENSATAERDLSPGLFFSL